jgi:4-amino-4-deoxy-L-arabinose transferase-like glycosyltransferase
MSRPRTLALGLLVLLAAAAVRLPPLTAALPYMSYVDEGHVLHRSLHLLAARTWEPDTYSYPSLPFYLEAAAALAWSPIYAARHGRTLQEDLSPYPPRYYDVIEPAALIVLGRLITLAFSLGLVVLTGLLARRLAGDTAGLFAAWLAALVPALVVRSAIVNVNPMVAFFTLAALLFAERTRDGGRPWRNAALAGIMTGLAATSKYPAVLVALPVALAVLLSPGSWRERVKRLLLTGGCAVATAFLAMPALVLRTDRVLAGLREMSLTYANQEIGSYWHQAVHRAEWDLPLEHPEVGIAFLALAAAGLVIALREPRWSRPAWGWLLFGAATGLLVAPYKFRAFRNLLPLVPLACVLIALLYARLRQGVPRPRWVDAAAAVLPLALFAPALQQVTTFYLSLEDSREQAVRWLGEHARPRDRVLFVEELPVAPARIAALNAETDVKPWELAWDRIFKRRFRYIVVGELSREDGSPKIPGDIRLWIFKNYALVARFGLYPTNSWGVTFNGNGQIVYILKRVPKLEDARPRTRGASGNRAR